MSLKLSLVTSKPNFLTESLILSSLNSDLTIFSEGILPRITSILNFFPSLKTDKITLVLGFNDPMILGSSSIFFIFFPSTEIIISLLFKPDFKAGLPSRISDTSAPSVFFNLRDSAISGEIDCITTPSHPLSTFPFILSCSTISTTVSIGIANPIPWPLAAIAVLTPITLPFKSNSGPPLVPLFNAASVCIKSTYVPNPSTYLPLALIIPVVTVVPNPSGFPIATTHWPIFKFSDLPIFNDFNFSSELIFNNATSVLLSVPTIFALYFFSLCKTISISSAFSITWKLVTINPVFL